MIKSIVFSIACILGSVTLHYSSDYMQSKDVSVTLIDRHIENSHYKGRNHERLIGLFKTDDGRFFDREISFYIYSQMHLGEKFTINIRRFDIQQTPWENTIFFFGVAILFSIGCGTILATLLLRGIEK